MFKKLSVKIFTVLAISLVVTAVCFAFTLLSKEEALKEVFWSGAKIETETKELVRLSPRVISLQRETFVRV